VLYIGGYPRLHVGGYPRLHVGGYPRLHVGGYPRLGTGFSLCTYVACVVKDEFGGRESIF
jgi:hypothetical protein